MVRKLTRLMWVTILILMIVGLTACGNISIAKYKVRKKKVIDIHVTSKEKNDYTRTTWIELNTAATEGKHTVESAMSKDDVDIAVNEARAAIDAVNKLDITEVVSIHFFRTENFIYWQNHKFFDFINKTYSTKRILVDRENGELVTVEDEDYKIKATFTHHQTRDFFEKLVENKFFHIEEHYYNLAYDADSWSLIVTFSDGTILESNGYAKLPKQVDIFDEIFFDLAGYKLFRY